MTCKNKSKHEHAKACGKGGIVDVFMRLTIICSNCKHPRFVEKKFRESHADFLQFPQFNLTQKNRINFRFNPVIFWLWSSWTSNRVVIILMDFEGTRSTCKLNQSLPLGGDDKIEKCVKWFFVILFTELDLSTFILWVQFTLGNHRDLE